MDIMPLVAFIVVIAIICTLFSIPERFEKLLYILGAVLVLFVVLQFFGIGGHLQLK